MSIKINEIEWFPFDKYEGSYEWYEFKGIKKEEIPDFVLNEINKMTVDKFKLYNDYEYENKLYRLDTYTNKFKVVNTKTNEIEKIIKNFEPFLQELKNKIGSVVVMTDLPITKTFKDYSKPFYSIEKDIIVITIEGDGPNLGSAGGPSMKTLVKLANIHISGKNGEKIKDFCDKCNSYTYE